MRKLCFTVDVDRDVNEPVHGRMDAGSLNEEEPRFTSSEAGVNIILDMLDEIGISATFFTEARTLENIDVSFGNNEAAMHGLDHEDLTGEITGVHLSNDRIREIIQDSVNIIRDRTGKTPQGFRAPYMRTNENILNIMSDLGMAYDSSLYAEIGRVFLPYDLGNGMKEIPIPFRTDINEKKMYAYLWSMHEGIRRPEEFIEMAETVYDGIFVLGTHSWHIVETRSDGMMDEVRSAKNIDNVREVITSLLDNGFKATRMIDSI